MESTTAPALTACFPRTGPCWLARRPGLSTGLKPRSKTASCTSNEVSMTERLANWLDDRFAWRAVWEAIFLRKIPHVNWSYPLGSATLFVAILQGVTGILLTLYYVPTPD